MPRMATYSLTAELSVTRLTDPKDVLTRTANTAHIYAPSVAIPTMTPNLARNDPWKVITPLLPKAWFSILSDLNLISTFSDIPIGLTEGFCLGAGPPLLFALPHPTIALHMIILRPYTVTSMLRVVPKSNPSEYWIIQDLSFPQDSPINSSVNSEINTSTYSCTWGFFDDIVDIILTAPPGTMAATLDINAAYCQMPIHPDDQPNLVVAWGDLFFIDHCAPFGAASSNGIFSRCSDAMWLILMALLKLIVHKWVDNFVVFRPPPTLPGGTTSIEDIYTIALPLGWPWKPAKTCPFAFSFIFLGFEWSIPDHTISIPLAKHKKYLSRLDNWLNSNSTSLMDTQRLAARDEALWWRTHLDSKCTHYLQPSPSIYPTPFYMDASTTFGIAVTAESQWVSWHLLHPWRSEGRDISWAKMVAVAMALELSIALGIHNSTVCFRSDNQGVVFALEAGHSRSHPQNELIKFITLQAAEFNIHIHTSYIASADNPADHPSHGLHPTTKLTQFSGHINIPPHLAPFLAHATLVPPDNPTVMPLPPHTSCGLTHPTTNYPASYMTMHNCGAVEKLFMEACINYQPSAQLSAAQLDYTPLAPPPTQSHAPHNYHSAVAHSPDFPPHTPSCLIPTLSHPEISLSPTASTGLTKALQHGLVQST
ncbi:reverse transcriptase [Ceratobasidium theobromae]|uniref:Reverse transcriptase n=1 Tax=Ceratobasidium theobromae TaxID=1582974 RepID=A0A5N5Q812_9AGAM|nr:reverse transcriptase [Ceratobasidium theobromae]